MSDTPDSIPPSGSGNQLHDEAADWFALLRGPDAEVHRPAFEAWLNRGAIHRAAYSRIAEIFTDSEMIGRQVPGERHFVAPRPNRWKAAIMVSLLVLAVPATWYAAGLALRHGGHLVDPTGHTSPHRIAQYATVMGEIRTIRLADGSSLTLDTDSLVSVSMSATERHLQLLRGRARFTVAHEARPFQVAAGNGVVTAHGTIFDVQRDNDGHVSVHLLQGAIDVALVKKPASSRAPVRQRLVPGEKIDFTASFASAKPIMAPVTANWPGGIAEFHDAPLSQVVAEANRYALVPIRLASADLGDWRVSGLFRLDDSRTLSNRLAMLLDLECTDTNAMLLLHRPETTPEK